MQFIHLQRALLVPVGISFLLISLVTYGIFITSSDVIRLETPVKSSDTMEQFLKSELTNKAEPSPSPDSVRIFIGVVVAYDRFGQRSYIRETYNQMKKYIDPRDTVTVKFIVGKNKEVGMDQLISWENETWGDIVVINQLENMNDGKTYNYFKYLYDTESGKYDYAMKLDDDTFLNIPTLLNVIRPIYPREGAYIGRSFSEPAYKYRFYMLGAGYILSWDYVTYIGQHKDLPRIGMEDKLLSSWIYESGIEITNKFDMGTLVIDHPKYGFGWSAAFEKTTVMVHQVKSIELWGECVEYFFSHVFT